jgi:2,5-diamino-6-(ribosylamino)-4(3H)-pyrimidinone 5'-phosphate reductase
MRPVEEAGLMSFLLPSREDHAYATRLRLRTVQPRPYVFVNMAVTADGKIDTVERKGARVSGTADTARVDRLRADADAVMVGGYTLLQEDPQLTVRDPDLQVERQREGRPAQPTKVGVASRIGLPGEDAALPEAGLFLHSGGGKVVVCTSQRTTAQAIDWLQGHGVMVVVRGDDRVDLPAALDALWHLGIERLMVEGGSTLVAALLEAGLVDELQLAVAPLLFGGETAPTPVGGAGWLRDQAVPLSLADISSSEDGDVVLRYLIDGGTSR